MRTAAIVGITALVVGAVVLVVVTAWFCYVLGRIVWSLMFPRGPQA